MGIPFNACEDDEHQGLENPAEWLAKAKQSLESAGIVTEENEPTVSAVLEYVIGQRRAAFHISVDEEASDAPDLLSSRVGGLPYLPPGSTWPVNAGTALTHLWQLRVAELPAAVQLELGHSRGLLQLFIADTLDDAGGDWYVFRVLDESQLVPRDRSEIAVPGQARRRRPAGGSGSESGAEGGSAEPGEDDEVEPPEIMDERAVSGFERVADWPQREDLMDGLPGGLDAALAGRVVEMLVDAGLCSTAGGDKLLGWPNWCQGSEWIQTPGGQRYTQVMQVEGSVVPFSVGDSGTLLLQRHPTDFGEWRVSWACC
ncbi:hypothetical protein HYH03_012752 [Edaphochlamys debaryana]|uniref:DUF1963 domain-containing protein n=1 Tax=Edaphochlamys debaryana TaxID=47281 RepID=A0A836BV86_9CHLO|nr:hypothetical protein HYH03_012752 [Edaphochlamys debaryana]|eukprot:KAG2488754.1 hypothetical protein HYH03_012752 [Edaphochlamys debaryana]